MAKIVCKEGTGRTYVLELGSAILAEMTPKITDSIEPSLLAKFSEWARSKTAEEINDIEEDKAMQEMELTEEEWEKVKDMVGMDEMGPELLAPCLLYVDGTHPAKVINPNNDQEYGTIMNFIDKDEDLVDDLPELMGLIREKLEKYHLGLISQGELRRSSGKRSPKKAN